MLRQGKIVGGGGLGDDEIELGVAADGGELGVALLDEGGVCTPDSAMHGDSLRGGDEKGMKRNVNFWFLMVLVKLWNVKLGV